MIPVPLIRNRNYLVMLDAYPQDLGFTLRELCDRAGYSYKVTQAGDDKKQVVLSNQKPHSIGWTQSGERIYIVDVRDIDLSCCEGYEKVLEILAYGFNDYSIRESVRHV